MSFALVLKKTSWYRRRYSRPLRVNADFSLPCGRKKVFTLPISHFETFILFYYPLFF